MKRSIILFFTVLLMASCSSPMVLSIAAEKENREIMTIDHGYVTGGYDFVVKEIEVRSYGVFNQRDKVPGVEYKIRPMAIILSVVFSETLIVPFIGLGWCLWKPKSIANSELVKQYILQSK